MRTLQVADRPTRLAQALAEFGRIDKTLHSLTYIDDEDRRRATLTQLNRGEGRHSLGRAVFHGKRGELRQRYREGQEDQLGALGLVLNVIVLWSTIYMDAALTQLRAEGYSVRDEMWHGYRHSFMNTSICWAATPLWYRNPWSVANSGRCALQRTMSLNCIHCSVTPQTPSLAHLDPCGR